MLSFYVKFVGIGYKLVNADTEFDVWAMPGVISCQILGGQ